MKPLKRTGRCKVFLDFDRKAAVTKEIDCNCYYTDSDSIFININVPEGSDIKTEMNKIKDILHNNELGKMKDELPNNTIIEACFLKAKAYCYTTAKVKKRKS